MSERHSGLLHGLFSRGSNKSQTRAEKILALERIEDPRVREQAIAWHLWLMKIVDVGAIALLVLFVISAALMLYTSPALAGHLAYTTFLSLVGGAALKRVINI